MATELPEGVNPFSLIECTGCGRWSHECECEFMSAQEVEHEAILTSDLPAIRQRWEQEVRERLLSDESVDAMAAVMCNFSSTEAFRSHGLEQRSDEWIHWRRAEARIQLEKFARLSSIFGEAEPFAEIDEEEFDRARKDPNVQAVHAAAGKHIETLREEGRIDGEAEPVEDPRARVERLEAELVEAEAAVERKRQEDGP